MSDNDIAMRVEGLGKMYRLGREIPHATTLTGKLKNASKAPFQWLSEQMREPTEEETLWALKDVSFEIKRGEVVGFIGHNGAGKSTLLKILSRITEPTTGYAEIHGRIAALLEVGTGMHPELTGRENIYMNGTVLGMKKREIDSKFDEIVDFSGISKFLDTPVKRYSSGMRVRLGFAIAAHLEPEILVVDEVLAVGDADFQAKCLGKMQDVASGGRTVLFVSHNMDAIRTLCTRAVLLQAGELKVDGPSVAVVEKYHTALRDDVITKDSGIGDATRRRGSGCARISSVSVLNIEEEATTSFEQGEDVLIDLSFQIMKDISCLYVMIGLRSGRNGELITTSTRHAVSEKGLSEGQTGTARVRLPNPNLRPGDYPLYIGLANEKHKAFDVMDGLTAPLIISTSKTVHELGYDPTKACGYFDIESEMEACKRLD
ncbi:MAG: ABC transporter ATP-binding protein [Verrucomicrobia bacterium]|jgi:lipopolysaccharide transport system ATP-binding protein|nr:ABC transporter ATP-binding protein [Verrucomicrobiota bacterium]MBT7067296.1 ABC transporter ATP-binding protein [Verrucomicrobiota bacterium]